MRTGFFIKLLYTIVIRFYMTSNQTQPARPSAANEEAIKANKTNCLYIKTRCVQTAQTFYSENQAYTV